ncbi:MAG: HD domain-containing protein [Spirochaetales bacterium]|nr:HD domain-containing protein [Spirochaetales bacterium]
MNKADNNNRILIIDDNPLIHNDFKKILTDSKKDSEKVDNLERFLFGDESIKQYNMNKTYLLEYAFSGDQALKMVEKAKNEDNPFALAFVDVRMPPGWDGIETIAKIWEVDPYMEVAICTAYADYSWDEIVSKLGYTDQIIIIKKPFEKIEVKQLATALVQKWNSTHKARSYVKEIETTLQKKIETITMIIEFANKLNTLKNLDDICSYIIEFVATLIQSERISIMLVDEKKQFLTIVKSIGIPKEIINDIIIKPGEGIAGKVFLSDSLLVVNNIENSEYPKNYSTFDSFLCAPFICAPLKGNKINLGVINVTNKRKNASFTAEDEHIMSYISCAAAVTLNNQLNEMKLEETFLGSIKALAGAIEAKDPYTKGHSERVSTLAQNIALELGFSKDNAKIVAFAALVHDIGKIGIPGYILSKPGSLSEEEFEQIKKHPEIGENILKDIKFLTKVKEIVRHHHERLDGSGYPDGLVKANISIEARILAVADTYDAMKSDRPYRKGLPLEKINNELMENSGIKYDFECVQALFRHLNR